MQSSFSYEVQLDQQFRRLGLGQFLVGELIRIGKSWKMEKVMLTALKGLPTLPLFPNLHSIYSYQLTQMLPVSTGK